MSNYVKKLFQNCYWHQIMDINIFLKKKEKIFGETRTTLLSLFFLMSI